MWLSVCKMVTIRLTTEIQIKESNEMTQELNTATSMLYSLSPLVKFRKVFSLMKNDSTDLSSMRRMISTCTGTFLTTGIFNDDNSSRNLFKSIGPSNGFLAESPTMASYNPRAFMYNWKETKDDFIKCC